MRLFISMILLTSSVVFAGDGDLDGIYFVVKNEAGKPGSTFTLKKNLLGNDMGLAQLKFDSTTAPDTNVYTVLELQGMAKEGEKPAEPTVACKISIKQNINDDSLIVKSLPLSEGHNKTFCDIIAGYARKRQPEETNMESRIRGAKENVKWLWNSTFNREGKFEPIPGTEGAK
jgi:hypothetical protein